MQELLQRLFDRSALAELNQPVALVYLGVALLVILLGRRIYSASRRYELKDELAKTDNPAVAIAFAAYLFALGGVLFGVLTAGGLAHLGMDLLDLAVTGLVGALLLIGNQLAMDRFSFPSFSLPTAIAERNIAAALVQAGGYLGSGMVIAEAIQIEGLSFSLRLLDASIFFVATQMAFLVFTKIYQRLTPFALHAEIERGNVAVAISYGLSLVATGHMLAYAVSQTASLVVLAAWFVGSTVALHCYRWLFDKIMLPGHDLNHELVRDQNWGVALVEGCLVVVLARFITGVF